MIDAVNLGQSLDEIDGVAFVAPELCSDSVGVDRDPQTLPQKLSATNKHKSLFLAGSRGLSIVAVTARVALTDACGLTAQSTEVVKLRASDATAFYEIDVVDDRRVQRENSFDADAKTRLSHCDCFARAPMFARDHDAF